MSLVGEEGWCCAHYILPGPRTPAGLSACTPQSSEAVARGPLGRVSCFPGGSALRRVQSTEDHSPEESAAGSNEQPGTGVGPGTASTDYIVVLFPYLPLRLHVLSIFS